MYKAVIFDLDGTLLDTIDDLGDSVNLALEELGYPQRTTDEYKLMVGNGFENLIRRAFPGNVSADEGMVSCMYELFRDNYSRLYMEKTKPYDGICEVVEELYKKGVPMAVDSNKRESFTVNLIHKFFPKDYFRLILGELPPRAKKPDPVSVEMISKEMGIPPREILFVGDTRIDVETGKNAGCDVAGVLWGFRDEKELREAGADYIIKAPRDILPLLCSS